MAGALPVGRVAARLGLMLGYLMPAAAIWSLLGLLLNLAPLKIVAVVSVAVYSALYGVVEAVGSSWLRTPSTIWQVPSSWVRSRASWHRVLVWGSVLGPGFATVNPYAGFWLLLLIVASIGNVVLGVTSAVVIGGSHAVGRAAALVRDIRQSRQVASATEPIDLSNAIFEYKRAIVKATYWRALDGYAMLTIFGMVIIGAFQHLR
jgi:hypothetical protein